MRWAGPENQNTHFMSKYSPPPGNRSFFEIMGKNIVQPTDDCIIRGMSIADTHSEYVILIAFPL